MTKRLIVLYVPPFIIGGALTQIVPSPMCYFVAFGVGLIWGIAVS